MSAHAIRDEPQVRPADHGAHQVPESQLPAPAERALTFGLLLSALRCTLQYVLLPFVLPWIGFATSIPPWLTLAIGGLALAALVRNVRYMWRLHHARRWSYFAIASVVTTTLLVFMVMDVRNLLGI